MPTYSYVCPNCKLATTRVLTIDGRNVPQTCERCGDPLDRVITAVPGKVSGRPVQGGGPDRFTADMLGIPLKELPSGMRTPDPRA